MWASWDLTEANGSRAEAHGGHTEASEGWGEASEGLGEASGGLFEASGCPGRGIWALMRPQVAWFRPLGAWLWLKEACLRNLGVLVEASGGLEI